MPYKNPAAQRRAMRRWRYNNPRYMTAYGRLYRASMTPAQRRVVFAPKTLST